MGDPIVDKIVTKLYGRADDRMYATDREETESCERLTPGCSINHTLDDGDCETW